MKILLVEDELGLARPLIQTLEGEGYIVDHLERGDEVLSQTSIQEYDCLVLDLNLPGKDGLEVAAQIRENGDFTPILMLTARTQTDDKIAGFESGTDDYLTKPFNMKELLLRIESLIKRSQRNQEDKIELGKSGELVIDLSASIVEVSGEQVELKNKEFQLLEYLARNLNTPVSAEELLEHVWDSEVDMFTDTVKTHIKTLRQKLDPEKKFIVTKRGQGYMLHWDQSGT